MKKNGFVCQRKSKTRQHEHPEAMHDAALDSARLANKRRYNT